ncbi:MAG: fasciclin domain-containing protein [Hyphomicrobiales bacterium]|nr:fasciclin domain-containing protein [Hyphomicrobiales bacterium]
MLGIKSGIYAAVIALSVAVSSVSARAADIVDTAVQAGQFKTLVTAVKAAGLVDTLKGKGPFTVFAPTDRAFAKLPRATLRSLLRPANRAQLRSILTYHVVAGRFDAARITRSKSKQFGLKSVQGSNIRVDLRRGVKVSGANVIRTDIRTSNGIIHVIDTVMLPPARGAAASRRH